jgi:hypothetical protein
MDEAKKEKLQSTAATILQNQAPVDLGDRELFSINLHNSRSSAAFFASCCIGQQPNRPMGFTIIVTGDQLAIPSDDVTIILAGTKAMVEADQIDARAALDIIGARFGFTAEGNEAVACSFLSIKPSRHRKLRFQGIYELGQELLSMDPENYELAVRRFTVRELRREIHGEANLGD